MFCRKCGTEIPEGTSFCPNCGTAAETPAPAVSPSEPSTNVSESYVVVQKSTVSAHKFPIKMLACVLAVILLIVGIASCFGNNPKNVAKKYYENYLKGDYRAAMKYTLVDEKTMKKILKNEAEENDASMKEFYDAMEEYYDAKIRSVGDVLKAASKKAKEDKEDQYGKFKVSVEVRKATKLDKDELESLRDKIDDDALLNDYFEGKKVKAGYEVKLKYKIKGKDDHDSDTVTLTVIKYGGRWKILSQSILSQLF